MPENVFMGQLHLSKACWELSLSDDQPHSDYNGQWQRALCMLAVLQSSQPNPQRNEKGNMYAIKQIKISGEYRDMLPRPRLDLSGTPGLRPIGLSPGSWQISLGLGSMSRYSALILICIIYHHWFSQWLAPTLWQAITWTNDDKNFVTILGSLDLNQLRYFWAYRSKTIQSQCPVTTCFEHTKGQVCVLV